LFVAYALSLGGTEFSFLLNCSIKSLRLICPHEKFTFMKFIEKFERFLDRAADQVGGYKILVVLALVVGYLLGSIFS